MIATGVEQHHILNAQAAVPLVARALAGADLLDVRISLHQLAQLADYVALPHGTDLAIARKVVSTFCGRNYDSGQRTAPVYDKASHRIERAFSKTVWISRAAQHP